MKIYISGPVSLGGSCSPEQIASFCQVFEHHRNRLEGLGYEVFDPTQIPEQASWADYMKICIAKVCTSDSVATLPRWTESRGATLEVFVATQLGIPVDEASLYW